MPHGILNASKAVIELDGQNIEVLNSTKLLGTIISNDLKWDLNTNEIVKKANSRMALLRKLASFGASQQEMKIIYFGFVRSQLEKSATVWHSSLTDENRKDLERVQKTGLKIILKNNYTSYQKSLLKLDIDDLATRREKLCLDFAMKCTKKTKFQNMFPKLNKFHKMKTRNPLKYEVQHANTERLKKSAIIYMQRLLNNHDRKIRNIEK